MANNISANDPPDQAMSVLAHGVELSVDGKPAALRFGMLTLLYRLYGGSGAQSNEPTVQTWLKRHQSEVFRHSVSHFQQCLEKFDCAVDHVARCRAVADAAMNRFSERARRSEEAMSESDFRLTVKNSTEVSLFLHAMFFYLRIQANTYAELVTFFYPGRDKDRIASDSFRTQREWFTDREGFDPAYRAILLANSEWFDLLSGENPKGLRDVIVHHKGMLQIAWSKPEEGFIEPQIALYRSDGVKEQNVFGALQTITAGWFMFLDAAWHHFVPRLREAGVLETLSVSDLDKTRWKDCRERELQSLWAYPIISS
jgi:hypothetical protein